MTKPKAGGSNNKKKKSPDEIPARNKITHYFPKVSDTATPGNSNSSTQPKIIRYLTPRQGQSSTTNGTKRSVLQRRQPTENIELIEISDSSSEESLTPNAQQGPKVENNNPDFQATQVISPNEQPLEISIDDNETSSTSENNNNTRSLRVVRLSSILDISDEQPTTIITEDTDNISEQIHDSLEVLANSPMDIEDVEDAQNESVLTKSDEELSNIDIDSIISSSQDSNTRSSRIDDEIPGTSSGNKRQRSPTKSPRSRAPYFSPIRHLKNSPKSASKDSGIVGVSSSSNSNSPVKKRLWSSSSGPYYMENFQVIVNSVVQDSHFSYLIHEEDMLQITNFLQLSKQAQCLYVRLFQRKWDWKVASSVKYPEIGTDLTQYFTELCTAKLLDSIQDNKLELRDLIQLLRGDQLVQLCKKMGVINSAKSKGDCTQALIKMSQSQKTLVGSSAEVIYKAVLKEIGAAYQLSESSRNLFTRIFLLHSPPQYWEDENSQTSNQLLNILLTNQGKMEYPTYKLRKVARIYQTRNDLIQFHDAWSLLSEVQSHIESKNFQDVMNIGQEAVNKLKEILASSLIREFERLLVSHLRAYTAGSCLTIVAWTSIDGFQKSKKYKEANEIIEFLLSQNIYQTHYRGRFYERLIINSKQYLKKSNTEMIDLIQRALNDEHTKESHRYTFTKRLEGILEAHAKTKAKTKTKAKPVKKLTKRATRSSRKKKAVAEEEDDEDSIEEGEIIEPKKEEAMTTIADFQRTFHLQHQLVERHFEGQKMDSYGTTGKSVFLSACGTSASSVETFAIESYAEIGYIYGIHGEGSVPTTLFGLLFWDIIYDDSIADVFLSPFQPFPLGKGSLA